MRIQKIVFSISLLLLTTMTWAAQCPGVNEIVRVKGAWHDPYDYYWGLTSDAKQDWSGPFYDTWVITPAANYDVFPGAAEVSTGTNKSDCSQGPCNLKGDLIVGCFYTLPDSTTLHVFSNKKMDISTLDLSVYDHHQESQPTTEVAVTIHNDVYSCNTTVANLSHCSWHWISDRRSPL